MYVYSRRHGFFWDWLCKQHHHKRSAHQNQRAWKSVATEFAGGLFYANCQEAAVLPSLVDSALQSQLFGFKLVSFAFSAAVQCGWLCSWRRLTSGSTATLKFLRSNSSGVSHLINHAVGRFVTGRECALSCTQTHGFPTASYMDKALNQHVFPIWNSKRYNLHPTSCNFCQLAFNMTLNCFVLKRRRFNYPVEEPLEGITANLAN